MKKLSLLLLSVVLLLMGCKEKVQDSSNPLVQAGDTLDNDVSSSVKISEEINTENKAYVMAPSGLTLRASNSTDSEKLVLMPYGSEVEVISLAAQNDLLIEGIKGGMCEIKYEDQKGFAFDGYLSFYPMPAAELKAKDYIENLKANYPEVTYTTQDNDPDFHEGYTEVITLPKSSWHEAYYIAKGLFSIPKSFSFPGNEGKSKEVLSDKDPPKDAWNSDLRVIRNSNRIDTIDYSYRTEGFGYGVWITKNTDDSMKIEYLVFVD